MSTAFPDISRETAEGMCTAHLIGAMERYDAERNTHSRVAARTLVEGNLDRALILAGEAERLRLTTEILIDELQVRVAAESTIRAAEQVTRAAR